jgi:hypothetical protein
VGERPISASRLNDSDPLHVEFKVDARKMEVKPDPKIAADTHAPIQKDMQEMTLESRRYPEITFRSQRVEKQAERKWSGRDVDPAWREQAGRSKR